jgi:hypothetical protein
MSGESVGGVEQFLRFSEAEIERSRHNLIQESLGFISGDLGNLRKAVHLGNLEHAQGIAAAIKFEAEAITRQLEQLK